jgi:hypothetical protein
MNQPQPDVLPGPPSPQPPGDRTVVVVAVLTALLFVGLAITVPSLLHQWREWTTAGEPTLDEVRVYDDVRTDHTEREVEYDPAPPPGGPHDPVWLACGAYDEPVRDENAVHGLEHGVVWLTYDPEVVSAADVALLEEQLPAEGYLSPYPGQDAAVIATVWQRQLHLDGADDERLALFIEEYGDGHTAPEPFASCEGGEEVTEDPEGDRGIDEGVEA